MNFSPLVVPTGSSEAIQTPLMVCARLLHRSQVQRGRWELLWEKVSRPYILFSLLALPEHWTPTCGAEIWQGDPQLWFFEFQPTGLIFLLPCFRLSALAILQFDFTTNCVARYRTEMNQIKMLFLEHQIKQAKVLSNEQMLLMQGQCRPCQDSICSMLACLWPQATALGDGSVLGTRSLFTELVSKTHSLVRNEMTHFLGAKKLLFVPLSGERRDKTPVHISVWKPRWDCQQSCLYGAIEQGKVAYPCLQHSQCNCLHTHMLHCLGVCLPWAQVTDFSLTDVYTMDGSVSL